MPTKARLTYFQDKSLTLDLQYKSEDTWTECFALTSTADKPIAIPSVSYLGFSAETGELSDNFDIISVEARNLYRPTSSDQNRRPDTKGRKGGRGRPAKSGSSWSWFFFKIIMFGMVVGGGYVGYTFYRTQQRKSRF